MGWKFARNEAGHVNQSQTMRSLRSHGKMFALYVRWYGDVIIGKEMTCSDQYFGKI